MTHNITVDNVTCSGCVSTIKKALGNIEGVKSVTVDQNSQLVHVEGNVEKSALTEKLFELGYPERG
jgi:copper chaperone CopZ